MGPMKSNLLSLILQKKQNNSGIDLMTPMIDIALLFYRALMFQYAFL